MPVLKGRPGQDPLPTTKIWAPSSCPRVVQGLTARSGQWPVDGEGPQGKEGARGRGGPRAESLHRAPATTRMLGSVGEYRGLSSSIRQWVGR